MPSTDSGARLRALMGGGLVQAMATHSPLSARLAEEAGFPALWASGFELSALYGLPDVSLITMSQHLEMSRAIVAATPVPLIADLDTGHGNAVNVVHCVRAYESAGAAAVVIEDKSFPKVTSLIAGGRQELVRIEEFQGKIEAARAARSGGLMLIARVEALIAGLGRAEALRRADAYAEAGADMVLVHSKQKTPDEIEDFVAAWSGRVPLVLVPTAYPQLSVARMRAMEKIGLVIWGNHAIRAATAAMQACFRQILAEQSIAGVEDHIASVDEIFRLQRMDAVRTLEGRYLR
jgi:phosphoenolpyruvate phosphomutase